MGPCPDLGALMRQNDALLDDRACMVLMDQPNKDRESYVRTAPHYSNAADVSCLIESIDGKVNAYAGASYSSTLITRSYQEYVFQSLRLSYYNILQ